MNRQRLEPSLMRRRILQAKREVSSQAMSVTRPVSRL
jgi:hypothetical protein